MFKEKIYKSILLYSVWLLISLVVIIFILLLTNSLPSIKEYTYKIFTHNEWDPIQKNFGALPFLIGTLITSFLALLISLPFAILLALFLGEYFTKGPIHNLIKSAVELLAGIPSLIYGFWGLFILVPIIRDLESVFNDKIIPLILKFGLLFNLHWQEATFTIIPYGIGLLTSSLILALMITPYNASLAQEVIRLVPNDLKEAGYALGATRWEIIRRVIVPYSFSGLIAGVLLSLGRALGETMAVTMVIGNSNFIPKDLFGPANTMASIIANEFTEATDPLHLSSLIELALILFVVTSLINFFGKMVINRIAAR